LYAIISLSRLSLYDIRKCLKFRVIFFDRLLDPTTKEQMVAQKGFKQRGAKKK